jgi:hypothetical protein
MIAINIFIAGYMLFLIMIFALNYYQSRFYGSRINIESEDDYNKALKEIESLWSVAEIGTPEGDRFEYLATIIDEYEKEHFKI